MRRRNNETKLPAMDDNELRSGEPEDESPKKSNWPGHMTCRYHSNAPPEKYDPSWPLL